MVYSRLDVAFLDLEMCVLLYDYANGKLIPLWESLKAVGGYDHFACHV